MPRYSDADLLDEIRRVADLPDVDGVPSEQRFADESDISSRTVRRRFGSWRAAIEQAGLGPHTQADKIPREKLVAELRWLRDEVGQIPTADQMDERGAYAYITYYERFGSWGDALEAVFGEVPDREWKHVSNAELSAELRWLAGDSDGPPTTTNVREHGAHAVSTYVDRFGSWGAALEAAGFEPPSPQGVTTAELLADVRRLSDQLGGKPTTTDVRDHGIYSLPTYYDRFDSWGDVLDAAFEGAPEDLGGNEGNADGPDADDTTDTTPSNRTHSDEDLLDEIRRVAEVADSDGAPSLSEFDEHSDIADSTIHRRFGSWNEGVAAAGFEPNPSKTPIPEEELAAELHRIRDTVGHLPTMDEMRANGSYSVSTYKNRYGSWTNALLETFDDVTEASIGDHLADRPEQGNSTRHLRLSDADLLDELRALAADLDHAPTSTELREHGSHSPNTYMERFGSWTGALEAAGIDPPSRTRISDTELLADLRRLRDELGERPISTDVDRHGEYSLATYIRRFGSWSSAVQAAFDDETGT
ncbi:homing endonuclease associated repeat-containing protein [Halorubrum distributum]|uniref:Uncharacterized protein n=1 Tax=Halorubrum distributum TaxID=29283 RepID=A0A6B1IMR4_9EURY|nr:hypothetical protein [Halorubrum terrestre]MYL67777.1 hypothetical protein [Halorubrum terrestre]